MVKPEIQQIKQRFEIIGTYPPLLRAIDVAVQVAPTDLSVLITGESGVGKESFPQIIHQFSRRKHGRYIAVNCGAIPEGTIDSELFGHEKGAFTGAIGERKGYFGEANGGTIFLDEVGELPLSTQARLLRVLESGEFIKVGSSTVEKTDVRIVAATNANLTKAISEGRFREDLFYRVNVVELRLPPLCERDDDILLLAQSFLEKNCAEMKRSRLTLSPSVQGLLLRYAWPGNVRELNNEMKRAAALTPGKVVELENLSPRILSSEAARNYMSQQENAEQEAPNSFNLQEMEARLIRLALDEAGGRKSKAAELLGITREGLRKKLMRLEELS